MSRPKKELQKRFVVFCEGDTEYNYIDKMRKQPGVQIVLKPHFLIVNNPAFEYVACLHFAEYHNQEISAFLMDALGYKSIDQFKLIFDIIYLAKKAFPPTICGLNPLKHYISSKLLHYNIKGESIYEKDSVSINSCI